MSPLETRGDYGKYITRFMGQNIVDFVEFRLEQAESGHFDMTVSQSRAIAATQTIQFH